MKFKEVYIGKGKTKLEEIVIPGTILLFPDYHPPEFDENKTRKELVISSNNEKIITARKFDKVNYFYGADKGETLKLGYEFKYWDKINSNFNYKMLPMKFNKSELITINDEKKSIEEWCKEALL